MDTPKYKFFKNEDSKAIDIILHGGSAGMDSSFISKLFDRSKEEGNSVVAFNFPFFDRGQENSSGPDLAEEMESLGEILKIVNVNNYERVNLIGKSLGGIVASKFAKSSNLNPQKYTLTIFGFIPGQTDFNSFKGKITIIQGSHDKFGDIETIKKCLDNHQASDIKFISIEGADHSYRDPISKEAIYEQLAIDRFYESLKSSN